MGVDSLRANHTLARGARAVMSQHSGKDVPSSENKWQRMVLGASAALLLGAGMILAAWPGMETGSGEYFSGTLLKVGVVLGVAWLAAPQLERFGWHRLRGTLLASLIIVLSCGRFARALEPGRAHSCWGAVYFSH